MNSNSNLKSLLGLWCPLRGGKFSLWLHEFLCNTNRWAHIRWRNQNIFFVSAAWLIRAGASTTTCIWFCFELQAATTCSCASTALKNASQQQMLGCHPHTKPIQCGRWGNCMAPWNSSKLRHRKYQWSSLHFLTSCTHADTCCSTSWFSKVRSILASTENKKLSVCTTTKWI